LEGAAAADPAAAARRAMWSNLILTSQPLYVGKKMSDVVAMRNDTNGAAQSGFYSSLASELTCIVE
jgi:hypothetical protein